MSPLCRRSRNVSTSTLSHSVKAINDLRKHLNASVFVRFGHFAHIMWTG